MMIAQYTSLRYRVEYLGDQFAFQFWPLLLSNYQALFSAQAHPYGILLKSQNWDKKQQKESAMHDPATICRLRRYFSR